MNKRELETGFLLSTRFGKDGFYNWNDKEDDKKKMELLFKYINILIKDGEYIIPRKFRNVSFHKKTRKYEVKFKKDGVIIRGGYHENKIKGAIVQDYHRLKKTTSKKKLLLNFKEIYY